MDYEGWSKTSREGGKLRVLILIFGLFLARLAFK